MAECGQPRARRESPARSRRAAWSANETRASGRDRPATVGSGGASSSRHTLRAGRLAIEMIQHGGQYDAIVEPLARDPRGRDAVARVVAIDGGERVLDLFER